MTNQPTHVESPRPALRLSDTQQEQILRELDEAPTDPKRINQRRSERIALPGSLSVLLDITHPGGGSDRFRVRGRNVSDHGLSFLHGCYVHQGTRCLLTLRRPDDESLAVSASAVRCRYITGGAHEVGVAFDEPIAIRDFIANLHGDQAMTVPEVRYVGSVLLVARCPSFLRMQQYMLGSLGLDVTTAATPQQALEAIERTHHRLLMFDLDVDPTERYELVAEARQRQDNIRMLAVSTEDRPDLQHRIDELGLDGCLYKPVYFPDLTAALKHIMPERPRPKAAGKPQPNPMTAVTSERWANPVLRPLILAFVQDLRGMLGELEHALYHDATPPPGEPRLIAHQIAVESDAHGYTVLQEAALELRDAIRDHADAKAIDTRFHELRRLVDAARSSLAA